MEQNIDLKKLERKAWTTYFQDGLWDIFFGLMMLTMAIRSLTDNVWFTPLMLVAVLIFIIGKKKITTPRLGLVKFSPEREAKRMRLIVIICIAVIATCALLLLPLLGQNPSKDMSSQFMAVILVVISGSMAYFLDFPRLFIYGLMFAVGEVLWGHFGEPAAPYAMLIFGSAVLVIGLIILISFMRKYPSPVEEIANGN